MKPNSKRENLIREMHKTGCRLDDAAACADVALRQLRRERDELIVAVLKAGLSIRKVANIFGLSVGIVHRVFTLASMR
jgi:hypothetical protein